MNGLQTETSLGDLFIEGGGCVVAGTEGQTVEHVLVAMRGEWREFPLLGGELQKMQHGSENRFWAARAKQMCKEAGVAVNRIVMNPNGEITVE